MINALTIDVEDYWKIFSRDWLESDTEPTEAVVFCTNRLLDILDAFKTEATFFVVGEVARKFPKLICEIANRGHEIGSHGQQHYEVYRVSRQKFNQEVTTSKKIIEDITSKTVSGYRAPSFSIIPATQWALEVLCDAGYCYDSSVFPFKGRRYGWPGFSYDICRINLKDNKSIIEVPMSTIKLFGKTLPACGGGYLRHFPYFYTNWAMKNIVAKRPAIVYMHPYDIDTSAPPESIIGKLSQAKLRSKIRHALQLRQRNSVEEKLKTLFRNYRFSTIKNIIDQYFES
jgi:polysaccharide deacetylase family protein (PEP-CTERM system associated)